MPYELDGSPEAPTVVVAAHGAGGHMRDRAMLDVSRALRDESLAVARFNFPYRDRGSGRPDPMPVLMEHVASVVDEVRRELDPARVIVGGRSMGGRAASMLAAGGFACDGVLLFAYPLHPPGRQETLRDAHLGAIRSPVLCFNGTRDEFCTPALMQRAVGDLPTWTMHWLDGADHGFRVLKSSGRTTTDVWREVTGTTRTWLSKVPT